MYILTYLHSTYVATYICKCESLDMLHMNSEIAGQTVTNY